jgi:hypothetical protein
MELQKENLSVRLLRWLKEHSYSRGFKIDLSTKEEIAKSLGCSPRSLDNPLAKIRRSLTNSSLDATKNL